MTYPQRPGQLPFAVVCAVLLALPTVGMAALFERIHKDHPEIERNAR
jgi:hypothetical protein